MFDNFTILCTCDLIFIEPEQQAGRHSTTTIKGVPKYFSLWSKHEKICKINFFHDQTSSQNKIDYLSSHEYTIHLLNIINKNYWK